MEDFWFRMEMEWKKIASMDYGKIVFHPIPYHAVIANMHFRVRLDWTRSNAKQPKFDVIDSSRKLAKGCNWLQPSQAVAQQRMLAGCSKITY